MSIDLTETVNVDFYGDVEVTFDYGDDAYTITKVTECATNQDIPVDQWLEKEVVWALKCKREGR